jgi:hypothetical protein
VCAKLVSFLTLPVLQNFKTRKNRSFFSRNKKVVTQPVSQFFRETIFRQNPSKETPAALPNGDFL